MVHVFWMPRRPALKCFMTRSRSHLMAVTSTFCCGRPERQLPRLPLNLPKYTTSFHHRLTRDGCSPWVRLTLTEICCQNSISRTILDLIASCTTNPPPDIPDSGYSKESEHFSHL